MYSTFLSVRAFSIITVILLAHYCLCVCFLPFFLNRIVLTVAVKEHNVVHLRPARVKNDGTFNIKPWTWEREAGLNINYTGSLCLLWIYNVQPHIHRRQCITSSWKTIEHFHGFEGGAVKELLSTSFSLNKYGLMPVRHQPRLSQIVSSFLTSCWI